MKRQKGGNSANTKTAKTPKQQKHSQAAIAQWYSRGLPYRRCGFEPHKVQHFSLAFLKGKWCPLGVQQNSSPDSASANSMQQSPSGATPHPKTRWRTPMILGDVLSILAYTGSKTLRGMLVGCRLLGLEKGLRRPICGGHKPKQKNGPWGISWDRSFWIILFV